MQPGTGKPVQELTIDLPYTKLAARDWVAPGGGEAAAEALPVLAMHGWLDNAASFDPLLSILEDNQRRIVALDLPGHGHSRHRPPGVHTYFLDYVPIVFDVADSFGWDRFIILGHSMGAGIGTLAAGTFPERVAGLLLIDGLGPLSEEDAGAPARFRSFLAARATAGQQAAVSDEKDRGGGSVYVSQEQAVRARKLVGGLSDASARLLVERNLRVQADGDGYVWRSDARLKWPSPLRLTEKQVQAFLSEITAPTLLLGAADSQFAAYEKLLAGRMQCIRNFTLKRLPGGHHLHMENPAEVAPEVASFLKQLP